MLGDVEPDREGEEDGALYRHRHPVPAEQVEAERLRVAVDAEARVDVGKQLVADDLDEGVAEAVLGQDEEDLREDVGGLLHVLRGRGRADVAKTHISHTEAAIHHRAGHVKQVSARGGDRGIPQPSMEHEVKAMNPGRDDTVG